MLITCIRENLHAGHVDIHCTLYSGSTHYIRMLRNCGVYIGLTPKTIISSMISRCTSFYTIVYG